MQHFKILRLKEFVELCLYVKTDTLSHKMQ